MLHTQHTEWILSNKCKKPAVSTGPELTAYLRNRAVSIAMHESCKLHYSPIPAIICAGFAQHDLRYSLKDLADTFASCSTSVN